MAEIQSPSAYFVDFETTPQYRTFHHPDDPVNRPDVVDETYRKKFKYSINKLAEETLVSHEVALDIHYKENASLYAEFCQIVSVSIGKIRKVEGKMILAVLTITGLDEKKLLLEFCKAIEKADTLCAHNGKEFDYALVWRRLLINKIRVPGILNPIGKPSYKMEHLEDTMDMFSGTQWKYKTGLDLLANVFGVPFTKQGMSGADVAPIFFNATRQTLPFDVEAELKKIADYNAQDVVILAHLYVLIKQLFDIKIESVDYQYKFILQ